MRPLIFKVICERLILNAQILLFYCLYSALSCVLAILVLFGFFLVPLRSFVSSGSRIDSNSLSRAGLVDKNSFRLVLSLEVFTSPSTVADSRARHSSLGWHPYSLRTQSALLLAVLTFKVP